MSGPSMYSESGMDFLEILRRKEKFLVPSNGEKPYPTSHLLASPPSRANNPMVKDIRFGCQDLNQRYGGHGSRVAGGMTGPPPARNVVFTSASRVPAGRVVPNVRIEGFSSGSTNSCTLVA
eukprot:TRINITY_DN6012_c0_g1_i1.p2 TRINITY_DN6012_c0_g1~~TRINITY_DN6012_c0_g1_i1.p2  ORF type:complete len:121 (+),score=13.41 TRINITY_DN6012_c0_g1_i1:481-843(+)